MVRNPFVINIAHKKIFTKQQKCELFTKKQKHKLIFFQAASSKRH